MDSRAIKILIVCGAGGGIGSVIAIDIASQLAWIGFLVGAIIGYLLIEPMQIMRAISASWHVAWNVARSTVNLTRPDFRRWAKFFSVVFVYWAASMSFMLTSGFLMYVFIDSYNTDNTDVSYISLMPISALFFAFISLLGIFLRLLNEAPERYLDPNKPTEPTKLSFWELIVPALLITPPGLILSVVYLLWLAVKKTPTVTVATSRFAWMFAKTFFLLTHSNWRLLCLVDSVIGVAVGFASGNPLAGAIAGGLVGLLNYEIVSRRWLKLVPQSS